MRLNNEEYNLLNKIARNTRCDCWFWLEEKNGEDFVRDLEKGRLRSVRAGVSELMQALDCEENVAACRLTKDDTRVLSGLLRNLKIKTRFFKEAA